MKCPSCQSSNLIKARNDCGHFKSDGVKPLRMYHYRCGECHLIMTYAEETK